MKIQCDVCNKEEASVFCTADDAALCNTCDHRVHHANKLASKHHRFSLQSKEFPLCDICQEKRGILFCQQDKAILCRDCDVPIHTANEHTKKHNRFLLTGTKLSASSSVYHPRAASAPSSTTTNKFDTVPDFRSEVASEQQKTASSSTTTTDHGSSSRHMNNNGSSISHYLMEMLPGWHFEEFLDNCSASFGFCKKDDEEEYSSLPLVDAGDDGIMSPFFSSAAANLGIWVPQAPPPPPLNSPTTAVQISAQIKHSSNKRWSGDIYAVPQMSIAFKRSRLS